MEGRTKLTLGYDTGLRLTKEEKRELPALLEDVAGFRFTKTRGECGTLRPCPWVSCKYHLYLDVNPSGTIKINFPGPIETMVESCALDVADKGGLPFYGLGPLLSISRQRAHQLEGSSLAKLLNNLNGHANEIRELLDLKEEPMQAEETTDKHPLTSQPSFANLKLLINVAEGKALKFGPKDAAMPETLRGHVSRARQACVKRDAKEVKIFLEKCRSIEEKHAIHKPGLWAQCFTMAERLWHQQEPLLVERTALAIVAQEKTPEAPAPEASPSPTPAPTPEPPRGMATLVAIPRKEEKEEAPKKEKAANRKPNEGARFLDGKEKTKIARLEDKGWKLKDIAAAIGVAKSSFSSALQDKQRLQAEHLQKLAGIDLDQSPPNARIKPVVAQTKKGGSSRKNSRPVAKPAPAKEATQTQEVATPIEEVKEVAPPTAVQEAPKVETISLPSSQLVTKESAWRIMEKLASSDVYLQVAHAVLKEAGLLP